jgi:hypothetical protein
MLRIHRDDTTAPPKYEAIPVTQTLKDREIFNSLSTGEVV